MNVLYGWQKISVIITPNPLNTASLCSTLRNIWLHPNTSELKSIKNVRLKIFFVKSCLNADFRKQRNTFSSLFTSISNNSYKFFFKYFKMLLYLVIIFRKISPVIWAKLESYSFKSFASFKNTFYEIKTLAWLQLNI